MLRGGRFWGGAPLGCPEGPWGASGGASGGAPGDPERNTDESVRFVGHLCTVGHLGLGRGGGASGGASRRVSGGAYGRRLREVYAPNRNPLMGVEQRPLFRVEGFAFAR